MNRSQLSRAAGIHSVMIGRYEDRNSTQFTQPTHNTWLALNRALGMQTPASATGTPSSVLLEDATIDQIVANLKARGIGVTLSFPT